MTVSLDALQPESDRVDTDIHALAGMVDSAAPGWSRQVFSTPYRGEREWVKTAMIKAGLQTRIDPIGNVIGRLPGRHPEKPPIITGSHTDTVYGGGRFDGVVGVLGGIETARRLQETGTHLDHDLLVFDFLGEEPNTFGISCVGSRAIAGILTPHHLDLEDTTGKTLGAAIRDFGADPEAALALGRRSGSMHAYVELHVEQGPLLEDRGLDIGVVTAIAGIERLLATFTGRVDHAGTRPMDQRHDALIAAAEAILTVERVGCGAPVHGVTTTGKIESGPGAFNIVPNHARIWAEMRSVDPTWLHGAKQDLARQIADSAAQRGVETAMDWLNDQDPVPATPSIQDTIAATAGQLGATWTAVPSGAGHDAAHMAHLGPMGMIFIPSVGGRSHCPEEWTDMAHILTGIHTLTATIVNLDQQPSLATS